ncbi:hypothetical protein [Nocardioides ferulae]|uniref:hypothetical protein n=1 Tax=Nocardioides ferulae TaxID=2340821 RepID=UPI000EB19A3B|nr:hypothetical protein [Nocardioides ferulae]
MGSPLIDRAFCQRRTRADPDGIATEPVTFPPDDASGSASAASASEAFYGAAEPVAHRVDPREVGVPRIGQHGSGAPAGAVRLPTGSAPRD